MTSRSRCGASSKTNGREDARWALRAVPEAQTAWRDRVARLHACDCACSTPMPDGRTTYELLTDPRSRNAIEVAERFALGKANSDELKAAWLAAWSAAGLAAWSAAGSAAWLAAGSAAREWQAANLRLWLLTSDPGEEALRRMQKAG